MSDLDRMEASRHLLPKPGPQVVGELIERVRQLEGDKSRLERERDKAQEHVELAEAENERLGAQVGRLQDNVRRVRTSQLEAESECDTLRDLVKRAVRYMHGWEPGQARWSAVGCTFSVG